MTRIAVAVSAVVLSAMGTVAAVTPMAGQLADVAHHVHTVAKGDPELWGRCELGSHRAMAGHPCIDNRTGQYVVTR